MPSSFSLVHSHPVNLSVARPRSRGSPSYACDAPNLPFFCGAATVRFCENDKMVIGIPAHCGHSLDSRDTAVRPPDAAVRKLCSIVRPKHQYTEGSVLCGTGTIGCLGCLLSTDFPRYSLRKVNFAQWSMEVITLSELAPQALKRFDIFNRFEALCNDIDA